MNFAEIENRVSLECSDAEQERDFYKALCREQLNDINSTFGAVGEALKSSGVDFTKVPKEPNAIQKMALTGQLLSALPKMTPIFERLLPIIQKYGS